MQDFILQQVVPTVGLITGTFMTFAPYRAVLKASRDGTLGDLNATPFVFMLGNCCGWLAYSFLLKNVFVFLGNAPGFILAIWLNIQAIKLQYENHRSHELQSSIIEALEEMGPVNVPNKARKYFGNKSSDSLNSQDIVKRDDVAEMVEQIMVEAPTVDLIDPISTAPVVDENDQLSGEETGLTTTSTKDEYGSTDSNNNNSVNGDDEECGENKGTKGNHTFLDNIRLASETDQDGSMFFSSFPSVHRRDSSFIPPAVIEATERFVDYTTIVWDVAAQRTPAPASHELMVLGISTFWLCLITIVIFFGPELGDAHRTLIIGLAVNINLIFFYGAPLSKIATVLETKTSKMIHVPTMIFSLMNGMLWLVYGVAVSDPFIAIPNGFGAVLGVVQMTLCFLFPRHPTPHHHSIHATAGALAKSNSSITDGGSTMTGSLSLPEESTPLV